MFTLDDWSWSDKDDHKDNKIAMFTLDMTDHDFTFDR